MPDITNEPLEAVLSNYPIKVTAIRNESYKEKKGVWWIQTDEGMRILKKISNSEETLRYILDAVRHLNKNGVRLPRVYSTTDGREYAVTGNSCYVMTQAIEGRNPSYYVKDELALIVKELAKFHQASKGFQPLAGTKPKNHLGLWVEDYQGQLEDIYSFYNKDLEKTDRAEINDTIVREFPYFKKRAQEAIDGLKGDGFSSWVAECQKAGCLCHQDFAAGNLIITPSGALYVLDTDSLTLDIPARDIRKLLNKIMRKAGQWDIELTKQILRYYQDINPLTPSQWEVVKLDLMYPHLFIGAVNKFYYKRDKEWSPEKYLKKIVETAAFEKTIEPVLNRFHTIIPV